MNFTALPTVLPGGGMPNVTDGLPLERDWTSSGQIAIAFGSSAAWRQRPGDWNGASATPTGTRQALATTSRSSTGRTGHALLPGS